MNPTKNLLVLIILSLGINSNAQLRHTKYFNKPTKRPSFCSEVIVLDSLGYYFKEKGCEGTGFVSFGKYKISKKNIVSFFPLPFDSLQAIRQIKRYKSLDSKDSIITITIFDRYDRPIDFNLNIDAVDTSGKMLPIYTNENGQIILNRTNQKDIVLRSLILFYGESPAIVNSDDSSIEVYLGLPELFLWLTVVTLVKAERFQLRLKDDGLYFLSGRTKLYSVTK